MDGRETYCAAANSHDAFLLVVYLAETPRADRLLAVLIKGLIHIVLLEQVPVAHLKIRLELAHHPRERDIRKLHIIVPATNIRMCTREPHLP
jgi:hypothetical protein